MLKLSAMAAGLSGGSLLGAVTTPPSSFSVAELTQLIIAITGLIAAVSAFVLGMRSRRNDPRDKLLEMLLKERKEALVDEPEPDPKPAPRRRRPRRQ